MIIMFSTLPFWMCLFWLALYLLDWKRTSHAQHMLCAFFFEATLLYACHAIYFNSASWHQGLFETVYAFCNIAVFPTYYLYIIRLTKAGGIKFKYYIWLAPAVIICTWTAIDKSALPDDTYCQTIRLLVTKLVFIIQLLLVCILGYRRLVRFDLKIKSYYSSTDLRETRLTRETIIVMIICGLISTLSVNIGRKYFLDNNVMLGVPAVGFAIMMFLIGYVGMRQSFSADDMVNEEAIGEEIEEEMPAPSAEKVQYEELCRMMIDQKLYLRPDLRLSDLTAASSIGRTRLSALLNNQGGKSFSDFVNEYRVEHAKELLKHSDDKLIMAALGEQSGFSSEAAFYRAFKKHTGTTPSKWQKNEK